jgi:hypothetical protein
MADNLPQDVPEDAAVLPLIPEELGIDPLLLAALHTVVFLLGSSEEVILPEAAEEALQYVATYLQRLSGASLKKVREDLATLQDFARQEKWPTEDIAFLKSFLKEFGVGGPPKQ